jgi:hypothetical protein
MAINVKPYTRLVSLGKHCQCGYQLRRYTGSKESSLFDSLGTPHSGLIHELNTKFSASITPTELILSPDKTFVYHRDTQIIYRHHFSRITGSNLIDQESIHREASTQNEKRLYLVRRWKRYMTSDIILFVRHADVTLREARELQSSLSRHMAPSNFDILFVTPNDPPPPPTINGIYIQTGFPMPQGLADWKGCDERWTYLLRGFAPQLECR